MSSLRIRNLSFHYGDQRVLDGFTATLHPGKFYCVLGPNGSGKTTLLKNIQKLLAPKKEAVYLCGKDVSETSIKELAKVLATVPQETSMTFDFSVLDYVLTGRAPHLERFQRESQGDYEAAKEAMEHTGIWPYQQKSVRALSGGELQRVIIARAMVQDPRVLLLDEPISHLDLYHQIHVLELVKQYSRKKNLTVVAVLHDINLASAYGDEMLLLKDGKVFLQGEPHAVIHEQSMQQVYGMDCLVLENPLTGKPHIIPHTGERRKI
ncbi:MAG TPA: ABC transporter [Clostridiaceae bacterium]|nr:ABC transporter [Clostridiaceae bacterium]